MRWWATAVVLAAVAGALLPRDSSFLLDRLHPDRRARLRKQLPTGRLPWWAVGSLAVAGVLAVTGSWVVAVAFGIAVHAAARESAARHSARRVAARRDLAVEALSAFVAELRGGAPARTALAAACEPALPSVAAAARSPAADPAGALRLAAGAAGYEPLRDLAAAWRLAERTGASLAGPVAVLASAARADDAVRRELAAQLAGPRATALLLSVLPVAGVLLGAALGADPVEFLLATPAGRVCLLAGTALVAAGLRWTELIVAAAAAP